MSLSKPLKKLRFYYGFNFSCVLNDWCEKQTMPYYNKVIVLHQESFATAHKTKPFLFKTYN